MRLNITPYHFEEIIKKKYTLDIVYMLKMIEKGFDVEKLCENSETIAVLFQSCIRKGLITEETKLTIQGVDLINFLNTKDEITLTKFKTKDEDFDKWWKEYPGIDSFEYEGRKFVGSRSLRQNRVECRIKFNKILLEGEYNVDQLIKALKYEVRRKKEISLKTGTNKLSYMQNSLTYLNQRTFESFIDYINEENSKYDREGQKFD